MPAKTQATVEDLRRLPADVKAEIVNGELVILSPTGGAPARAAGRIYTSLDRYALQTQAGSAFPDNVGYVVNLPHRASFSPDASFYMGEVGMGFLRGAPLFAAEVRSEGDYGRLAERALAEKRRDYFAAGTQVVWDVDLLHDDVVRVYRVTDPATLTVYHRGDVAEAEPAVPGWSMPVDELF